MPFLLISNTNQTTTHSPRKTQKVDRAGANTSSYIIKGLECGIPQITQENNT